MEARASVKYARISPRKVKIVLDLIRGKDANYAMGIIKNTPKAASEHLEKLLKSAIANATNNFGMDYKTIFESLDESIHFLPMKQIMSNYLESVHLKQYPHLHLLSCIAELMKCVLEITM